MLRKISQRIERRVGGRLWVDIRWRRWKRAVIANKLLRRARSKSLYVKTMLYRRRVYGSIALDIWRQRVRVLAEQRRIAFVFRARMAFDVLWLRMKRRRSIRQRLICYELRTDFQRAHEALVVWHRTAAKSRRLRVLTAQSRKRKAFANMSLLELSPFICTAGDVRMDCVYSQKQSFLLKKKLLGAWKEMCWSTIDWDIVKNMQRTAQLRRIFRQWATHVLSQSFAQIRADTEESPGICHEKSAPTLLDLASGDAYLGMSEIPLLAVVTPKVGPEDVQALHIRTAPTGIYELNAVHCLGSCRDGNVTEDMSLAEEKKSDDHGEESRGFDAGVDVDSMEVIGGEGVTSEVECSEVCAVAAPLETAELYTCLDENRDTSLNVLPESEEESGRMTMMELMRSGADNSLVSDDAGSPPTANISADFPPLSRSYEMILREVLRDDRPRRVQQQFHAASITNHTSTCKHQAERIPQSKYCHRFRKHCKVDSRGRMTTRPVGCQYTIDDRPGRRGYCDIYFGDASHHSSGDTT